MKKRKLLKPGVLPALLLVAVIGASSFTSTDEASKYDTTLCSKKNPDGSTSYTSACKTPSANGPCDTKKDCPTGYN